MATIGIFDSGAGGLSVFREIYRLLPGQDYVYFSDNACCPYGEKSRDFIVGRARAITDFLLAQGADIIVVACNTATAAAINVLRAEYSASDSGPAGHVMEITGGSPIFELVPFRKKKAASVTTGKEVYYGRIEDTFSPVIREKLAEYDTEVMGHEIWNDDDKKVTEAILRMIEKGADMVICTGGMSVDPDDKTPLAIKNTGARIVSYGAPVLPGAMFLLAYYTAGEGDSARVVPIMGLPGCVMYSKRTIFDLVLPRIMADDEVTAEGLASLGQGGLCLNCPVCTWPACGFGKGW